MPKDSAPARHPFLRKTVDLIDRAALNHVDPAVRQEVLERFVQDFQRHATGPMVEIGQVLENLVACAGFDEQHTDLVNWLRTEHDVADLDDLKAKVEEWQDENAATEDHESALAFVHDLRGQLGIGRVDTIELLRQKIDRLIVDCDELRKRNTDLQDQIARIRVIANETGE